MGTPENANAKLLEHLRGRRIASILEESNEKDDGIALKIMTIIDHTLEKRGIYTKIEEASKQISSPNDERRANTNVMAYTSDESSESTAFLPAPYVPFVSKLLKQLLSIQLFGKFHFFKYVPPIKKFNFILQCRQCSLIAPYFVILSHMVLSHGAHIGSKQCQWCPMQCRSDLIKHIQNNELEECYKKYLEKESIDDPSYPSVIIKFYEIMEDLAKELGVLTARRCDFTGVGKPKNEKYFDLDVVVYRHRRPTPIKNLDKLDKYFKTAIGEYYGNSRILEFMPKDNDAAIECDGQENGAALSTSSRRRTRKRQSTQTRYSSDDSQNNNQTSASVQPKNVPGTSSKRSAMNFGRTIDELIENIPSDAMKINAKLKVQSVVLEFSNKAYEQRINREHKDQE